MSDPPFIWFPATRTGTGTDVFTERLVAGLRGRGLRAEITWLPLRAEYAPWTVPIPSPPSGAHLVHINTWLHPRFVPRDMHVVATLHHAIHDPDLRPYKGFLRRVYHHWWIAPNERRILRRADQVTAVSSFAAAMAQKALADVPIEIVHNGVDTEVFSSDTRQRRAGEPFRLLYVGSWMSRKGVDLLAPIMRDLGSDYVLHYTGGAVSPRVKARMPLNMHDIGRLPNDAAVADAMRRADALLFPSRSEGFGLVAAEAISCGLPVIATRGSSLVEVVEDGVTGILCPKDNVGRFVDAIREMRSDPLRWAATTAFEKSINQRGFTHKKMIDAYLKIYSRALTSGF